MLLALRTPRPSVRPSHILPRSNGLPRSHAGCPVVSLLVRDRPCLQDVYFSPPWTVSCLHRDGPAGQRREGRAVASRTRHPLDPASFHRFLGQERDVTQKPVILFLRSRRVPAGAPTVVPHETDLSFPRV